MEQVRSDDVLQVTAAENQEPVEAFAADAPDPALSMRPRLRSSHGRLDDSDAFGAEDFVEVSGELAVAVTDKKQRADVLVVEMHQQVACLLGHPAAVGVGRDPGQAHSAGRQLDEEEDVEALQEERVDGEEALVASETARPLPA
jgi:hypothetical protein